MVDELHASVRVIAREVGRICFKVNINIAYIIHDEVYFGGIN